MLQRLFDLIAWLAKKMGWHTWYLVSYAYPIPGGGVGMYTFTVSITPWVRQGSTLPDLLNFMEAQLPKGVKSGNIISLNKIGR